MINFESGVGKLFRINFVARTENPSIFVYQAEVYRVFFVIDVIQKTLNNIT